MRRPFDTAVKQHGATVLRVCRAVLGPGPDADDAWSETFLAALKAWLVRVAGRKAIDVVRGRSRRAVPSADLPEQRSTLGVPGAGDGQVWEAVAALPERQRLAIAYHYFGGLKHTETAEIIGGRPDAV